MDDDRLAELKEIFSHFDKDKSNSIEAIELLKLMRALGEDPTADELAIAMEALDVDHNGTISFDEFVEWWNDGGR